VWVLQEKRDDDMALNKEPKQAASVNVCDDRVMQSAKKMSSKYRKTLDKLAKN